MPGSGRKNGCAIAALDGQRPPPRGRKTDLLMRYHPLPAQMPVNRFCRWRASGWPEHIVKEYSVPRAKDPLGGRLQAKPIRGLTLFVS